jgi:hypothetical protein
MSAIEQGIPHLLGGVSQQPATLRDESEGEEQINGLSLIATGLGKRPASEHAAVLSATPSAAYDSVHTHLVARNSTDRYRIVLSNGDLKVFDAATGTEQTVTFPNGKAYLTPRTPHAISAASPLASTPTSPTRQSSSPEQARSRRSQGTKHSFRFELLTSLRSTR